MASGHTITITPAGHRVEVSLAGQRLADSERAVLLQETGCPPRYYLPPEDVRTDLLEPTPLHTRCPFKGEASYWSANVGGKLYQNIVWSYETPIEAVREIAGRLCFYTEREAELAIDGEPIQAASSR